MFSRRRAGADAGCCTGGGVLGGEGGCEPGLANMSRAEVNRCGEDERGDPFKGEPANGERAKGDAAGGEGEGLFAEGTDLNMSRAEVMRGPEAGRRGRMWMGTDLRYLGWYAAVSGSCSARGKVACICLSSRTSLKRKSSAL
jgi:hypothetical protein